MDVESIPQSDDDLTAKAGRGVWIAHGSGGAVVASFRSLQKLHVGVHASIMRERERVDENKLS